MKSKHNFCYLCEKEVDPIATRLLQRSCTYLYTCPKCGGRVAPYHKARQIIPQDMAPPARGRGGK